jgi:phosphoglycolate phosphatase
MTRPRLARPRAVLFDWDNTLVDNWAVIGAALNAALTAMGEAPWSLPETKARVRASLRDSFPRMFGERWREAEKIYYARFAETHLAELREMPGAGRLLAGLVGAGFPLGVVSNKRGGYLRAEAAHLGWAGHFHRLVGSGDAPADKPAPDPVRLALDGAGVAAGPEVWFVGDADIDLACAAASGCLPVLLREAPPAAGEFAEHPPALHLGSCAELMEFIEKL